VKLINCLNEKTVEVRSTLKERGPILSRLVALVLATAGFMDPDALLGEIEAREKLGSTGIGQGVAIPHVHLKGIEGLHVAMMTVPGGVDFGAMDDMPCNIFIIVVGPDEDREGYLKLLAEVSRLLSKEKTRGTLLAAKTPAELLATIRDAEAG